MVCRTGGGRLRRVVTVLITFEGGTVMVPIITPDAAAVAFEVACLMITSLAVVLTYLFGARY
jgi:hypothetical protein